MKKIIISLCFLAIFHHTTAHAYTVYCTNCSDNILQELAHATGLEQLAELQAVYAETVQQTVQQIEMVQQNIEQYANMVQNTLQLPQNIINFVAGELGRLAEVTNALQTLRADVTAMSEIFDQVYLNTDVFQDLASAPRTELTTRNEAIRANVDAMSTEVDRASKATFQLSGAQLKELEESEELEDYINELLSTPEGQQQALMAGNQLASLQLYEARQLRELLATSVQSDLASQMKAEKQEQLSEELMRNMFDMDLDTTPIEDAF